MRNERDQFIRQLSEVYNISIEMAASIVDSEMTTFRGTRIPRFTDDTLEQADPLQPTRFVMASSFEELISNRINNSPKKMKSLEKEMKKRHLSSDERHSYHSPKSDWCESSKGEVCKSASSLDVSDLIIKVT